MHLPANLLVKNDVCVNVTGRTPVAFDLYKADGTFEGTYTTGSDGTVAVNDLPAGEHTLELKLLGNRENCFGSVHNADPTHIRIRPSSYRFEGNAWTESYRLKPLGILSAPNLEEI